MRAYISIHKSEPINQHRKSSLQHTQARLRQWEREEEEKRRLQREVAERLKADRAAQLADRDLRRRAAAERRAAEEAELAARLAHEARQEFEREEATRREAKEALKAFLLKWVWVLWWWLGGRVGASSATRMPASILAVVYPPRTV